MWVIKVQTGILRLLTQLAWQSSHAFKKSTSNGLPSFTLIFFELKTFFVQINISIFFQFIE